MSFEKLDEPMEAIVRAYYTTAIPRIAAICGRVPFTAVFCLDSIGGEIGRARASAPPLPVGVEVVDVPLRHLSRSYLRFGEAAAWSCLRRHAVAFESWTPLEGDPLRARFAHMLLTPIGSATETMLRAAARAMRIALAEDDMQAIPVLDGAGITLWIPLAGGPPYENVRGWLHGVVAFAMEGEPELFSTKPLGESAGRIHVWVGSNTPGQGCNLPYCLRVSPDWRVVAPIAWDELEVCANGDFRADNFEARFAQAGDRFAQGVAAIGEQRLPSVARAGESVEMRSYDPRSRYLIAAFEILADGKPRTAEQIVTEAVARDLLPARTRSEHLYISLKGYLDRTIARGARPKVVQDADYRFRINHPVDDWPTFTPASKPPVEPLLERLRSLTAGDPEAFENAVLDVFASLGFVATHLGGNDKPDGYLDAPLGPIAYRVIVECKTGKNPTESPDVWEAVEHKDEFRGDLCMLIYPEVADTTRVVAEAKTHGVSVWTLKNLETVARRELDLWTMRALFEPGMVGDRLDDLLWELDHGATRRIRTLCDIIASEGWRAQVAARGAAGDAPRLTVEAAMFLADARLHAAGSQVAATRSEVGTALDHLCDPLVNIARRLEGEDDAVVILRPQKMEPGVTRPSWAGMT